MISRKTNRPGGCREGGYGCVQVWQDASAICCSLHENETNRFGRVDKLFAVVAAQFEAHTMATNIVTTR